MKDMVVPIEVELEDGTKMIVDKDQQPRPGNQHGSFSKIEDPVQRKRKSYSGKLRRS